MISKRYIEDLIISFLKEHSDDKIELNSGKDIMESCLGNDWWSVVYVDFCDSLDWNRIESTVNNHFDKKKEEEYNYKIEFICSDMEKRIRGWYKKSLAIECFKQKGFDEFEFIMYDDRVDEKYLKGYIEIYEKIFQLIYDEKGGYLELPYEMKW